MSPLIRELLVNGLMAGTAVRTAKKTSASVGYSALAGGIAVLGFVFLSISVNALLVQYYPLHIAAAMTGCGILLLSLAVGLFGYYRVKGRKVVKKPMMEGGFLDNIENTMKSLVSGIEEPVKDNPTMALLLAALAGFAAGDQIGDRKNSTH